MKQKKGGFLTFCFSMIPGAAEMYMGFFKMGLSLMGLEIVIIMLSSMLNFDILNMIGVLVWFYSFFHAHNLAGMPDEDFAKLEDEYLLHLDQLKESTAPMIKDYQKVIAVVLILVGIGMVGRAALSAVYSFLPEQIYHVIREFMYYTPQAVVGIGIIALGVMMIRGKKKELEEHENEQ
ncbi:MAG: hypothetical protein PHP50_07745 [Lachnospiraceae bacterium]|nr:hypothetical protein [Lachnospiraceae bacterium]